MHALFVCHCVLRKGPPEKIAFPTVSQNTNPFQVLPSFLMTLGRKIDSAELMKARGRHVLIEPSCMHDVFVWQDKLEPHKDGNRRCEE